MTLLKKLVLKTKKKSRGREPKKRRTGKLNNYFL